MVKVWDVGSASGVGSLKLSWSYNGLESEEELPADAPGCSCLEAIKTDIKKIAIGYQNSVVKIFDVDTGKQVLTLQAETNAGLSFSFYRYNHGIKSAIDEPASMQVNSIASHPTMSILVTAHEDTHIRLWDSNTGMLNEISYLRRPEDTSVIIQANACTQCEPILTPLRRSQLMYPASRWCQAGTIVLSASGT